MTNRKMHYEIKFYNVYNKDGNLDVPIGYSKEKNGNQLVYNFSMSKYRSHITLYNHREDFRFEEKDITRDVEDLRTVIEYIFSKEIKEYFVG